MTAKILQFKRTQTMKKIDPELLKLMMKHHKLIHSARQRGYSEKAIAKLIKSAEESKR